MSGLRSRNVIASHGQLPSSGPVFPENFSVSKEAGLLRVNFILGSQSIVGIRVVDAETGAKVVDGWFADGNTLAAGRTHVYDWPCSTNFRYNVLLSASQLVNEHIFVQELQK